MKKLLILLSLTAILCSCHHGHKNHEGKEGKEYNEEKGGKEIVIPTAVNDAFAKLFAKGTDVEWSLETTDQYEAEFTLDKTEMAALFDAKGTLLETETPVTETDLPKTVKDSLAKGFAGYTLSEIEKVDTKGVVSYEMEVKKSSIVSFDAKGKLVKNEVKKAEIKEGKENKGEKDGEKKEKKKEEKED